MTMRIVTADTDFTWDGLNTAHLPRGTFIDDLPGSALEAAIGVRHPAIPVGPDAAAVRAGASN